MRLFTVVLLVALVGCNDTIVTIDTNQVLAPTPTPTPTPTPCFPSGATCSTNAECCGTVPGQTGACIIDPATRSGACR